MTLGSEPAFSLRAYEDAVARGQAADATLEVVVRCLASLRVAEERTTVERLQRQAVHALEARGVRPRRSRAGRVYVDVHRAAADAATRRGAQHTVCVGTVPDRPRERMRAS